MISLTLIDVDFERHPSIEHIAVMLDTEIRFLSPSSRSSIVTISSINVFQSVQNTHENTLAMQMTCIQCLWQHIHSTNINKFDLTRKKTPFSQSIHHTILVHQLILATIFFMRDSRRRRNNNSIGKMSALKELITVCTQMHDGRKFCE